MAVSCRNLIIAIAIIVNTIIIFATIYLENLEIISKFAAEIKRYGKDEKSIRDKGLCWTRVLL